MYVACSSGRDEEKGPGLLPAATTTRRKQKKKKGATTPNVIKFFFHNIRIYVYNILIFYQSLISVFRVVTTI